MKKRDIERFRELLQKRRKTIVDLALNTRDTAAMTVDTSDLADEVDLAASETGQTLNMRLRDRELVLLKKIDGTLKKIEDGEFGIFERCGEEVGIKRLKARPVAQLCIPCKEELEKMEKGYAD